MQEVADAEEEDKWLITVRTESQNELTVMVQEDDEHGEQRDSSLSAWQDRHSVVCWDLEHK